MVKQKKRTCITQSGKNYGINCANQNAWFVSSFCAELILFCTVFEKNCAALNQSKWRNFFMYIISDEISWCIVSSQ